MDKIYRQIFEIARPYYLKGRDYDLHHIEWILQHALILIEKENLDKELFLPLCILHDIGYSVIENNNPNPKSESLKRLHMKEGSIIARKILKDIGYNKSIAEKIVYYISVHANWVFGDDSPYLECLEMAALNDLDFIYAVSDNIVLKKQAKSMNLTLEEMYDFWISDEKLIRRPFISEYTKNLFQQLIERIKKV